MACLSSTSLKPLTILTEDDGVPGSKFDCEPEHYTVEQLKRCLKCRGIKLSGKRDELVTRVSDSIKKGSHCVLDVSIDQGKWFAAKVIKENQEIIVDKSIKSKLSFVPTVPVSGWCTFQSQDIPVLFNCGYIYCNALESIKTVVTESGHQDDEGEVWLGHMTAKPLKNGRKYVDSGFVHDMMDTKTEEHYFLKAHVWPSMRNELPHNVSVSSGAVISRIMRSLQSLCTRALQSRGCCFLCWTMSMNKGLPYQHHAPAKNVHGIKGKRETKTLTDCRRSSILQKRSSAVPKLLILTQGPNRSGELPPVTLMGFSEICKAFHKNVMRSQCGRLRWR